MNSYKEFSQIINGKTILYVPIISCINRDNQEYNLAADGNVNRFITTFEKCNEYNYLMIILPKHYIVGSEKIVERFSACNNITIIYSNNFGIHAGEQRNKDEVVDALYEEIKNIECDVFIFESQKLGLKFLDKDIVKIFWNPVSRTKEKTRVFLEGYEEINQKIIEKSDWTIIASPEQYEYYKEYSNKLIYLDILMDRNLFQYFGYNTNYEIQSHLIFYKNFGKTIYYLPFRLSDEGYKFNKVLDYILSNGDDFIVYYTDPNNCHILDKLKEEKPELYNKFYKVSSDRDTYYTFLDFPVVIPYFEDIEFINHAAIHEFMYNKSQCQVILYKQNNNPYNINGCSRIKNLN